MARFVFFFFCICVTFLKMQLISEVHERFNVLFFFFGWTCHPTTLSASGCCVTFYNPEHSSVSSVLPFCRKRLLSYSIPYKTISPTFLLTLSVLTLVPDDSARCRASISLAFFLPHKDLTFNHCSSCRQLFGYFTVSCTVS